MTAEIAYFGHKQVNSFEPHIPSNFSWSTPPPDLNNKHLMTGPEGNSEFCFPETLNVPRGEAEENIEVEGKQNSLFPMGQCCQ